MKVCKSFPLLAVALVSAACSSAPSAGPDQGPAGRGGRGDATVPVTIAQVSETQVPLEVVTVGTVEAESTVDVRAQVTGQLTGVHFTEGRDVERGQLLFTIDPRSFELAVKQAEATLERDMAQAKNIEATRKRHADLLKGGLISQAEYDATATSAAASSATLEADRNAIETARLNLQYTKILAPVAGRTGALLVHTGALVRAADASPLVTLNQISPIRVGFSIPGQYLDQIRSGQAGSPLLVSARPQGGGADAEGRLSFVDNAIDTATGTIRLKATFPNERRQLWPGQIVEATLRLAVDARAITVPSVAVQNGQQGQFVFVMAGDKTVSVRPVTVSRTRGDVSVVTNGLKAGETVVTDGQLRLMPGSRVAPK